MPAHRHPARLEKACTKCGVVKPLAEFHADARLSDGKGSKCKACGCLKVTAYRSKHPEVIKDYSRSYNQSHREQHAVWMKQWRLEHPEKMKAAAKRFREAHKEKLVNIGKRYRELHAEELREKARKRRSANAKIAYTRTKAWRLLHPDATRTHNNRRRALKRTAGEHTLTASQWTVIVAAYRGRCAYCGKRCDLQQEHVIPLSRGGLHTAANVVPACKDCNAHKHTSVAPPYQPLLLL